MSQSISTDTTHIPTLAPAPENPDMYFENTHVAGLGDIDRQRRLRLDSIARYLQNAGYDHLHAAGFGNIHPYWVVQRTLIDVLAPSQGKFREKLTVRRWCSGMARFWCSVRIDVHGDQGTYVETEAFWINFNKDSKSPARLSSEFTAAFGQSAVDHHVRWTPLLPLHPSEDALLAPRQPWTLRSSDIDQFHHVNNAAYWEAVEHLLRDSDLLSHQYRAIIEYISPIEPTEQVELASYISESEAHIWFIVEGKAKATVKIIRRF